MADAGDVAGFLDRERASWERFDEQVARIPEAHREVPGALEGWSVKDVVWHCAHWAEFAALRAEVSEDGPFVDPFDEEPDEAWEAENRRVAAESAAMTWEQVRDGIDVARARVRAAAARPGLNATVIAWMGDETWAHYDEHAAHVAAFADAIPA